MGQVAKMEDRVLELSVVETAVPSHMLWLMAKSVVLKGYELRSDMRERLSVGAAAPLSALADNPDAVRRAAKRIDDTAMRLLNALNPDDVVHGLYSVAMFALKLVDEKLLADADNMGVLVSMALIEDLKTEGGVESYSFRETLLQAEADKLIMAARKEGLYKMQLIAPVAANTLPS